MKFLLCPDCQRHFHTRLPHPVCSKCRRDARVRAEKASAKARKVAA